MIPDTLTIILIILAVYRLSRMIVGEIGPFSIFEKIRGWVYKKYDPDHWLYNGIGCPLCISFWLSPLFLIYINPPPEQWPLYWLAIAGGTTLIYRNLE